MTSTTQHVTILGAGMWGRALGHLVQIAQGQVVFWSRGESLTEAIAGSPILVSAVSMGGVSSVITQVQSSDPPPGTIIVTATKGLDPISSRTPSQLWQEAFPHLSVVVLSGPNLSKEIEQGLPAATAVASRDEEAAIQVQHAFASDRFRVYVNRDPLGTELGGTLKNVMAIAAGVCDGLHLGANAKAALLTRALPEITRVGVHLGAKQETFFGLSGLGDLLATCNGPLSRNYQVGYGLAQGQCLATILQHLEGTAEGINTTEVLVRLAQTQGIAVPIAWQVYQLLQGHTTPQAAVNALMARELTMEQ